MATPNTIAEADAAAVADATRARRLASQNDGLNPDSRVAEAGGHTAMLGILATMRREQKQTDNRSVGMAGPTAAVAATGVGKP